MLNNEQDNEDDNSSKRMKSSSPVDSALKAFVSRNIDDLTHMIKNNLINANEAILPKGNTLLMAAVKKADLDMIDALISCPSVDLDARGSLHYTPLMQACMIPEDVGLPIVESFLRSGRCKFNELNGCNYSAFVCAVSYNKPKYAELFIKNGSDANVKPNGTHSLIFSVMNHHEVTEPIVQLLLKSGRIDLTERSGTYDNTLLHLAALNNFTDTVDWLISAGLSVNSLNKYDGHPLHMTAIRNASKAAEKLIACGADVNAFNGDGRKQTTLCCAAGVNSPDVVEVLLKCDGIDANACNIYNQTPLHVASVNETDGAVRIVEMLLNRSKVNELDKDGFTPFQTAVLRNKVPKVIETFLNCDKVDVNGMHSVLCCTPLHLAVIKNVPKVVSTMLKHERVNANARNNKGCTALHLAVLGKSPEMVDAILKNGERVAANARNDEGNTPLHLAVLSKSFEVVSTILKHGERVAVDARNNKGDTPLHLAVHLKLTAIIDALVKRGADVNATNDEGNVPFQLDGGFDSILLSIAAHLI